MAVEQNIILSFFVYNRKDGYLFDKEAILQYIISKKTEYARKLKEYERQKQIEDNESAELDALAEQKKLMKFINTEKNVVPSSSKAGESPVIILSICMRVCEKNVLRVNHK